MKKGEAVRFLRNRPLVVTIIVLVVLSVLVASTGAGAALAEGAGVLGGILVPAQHALYQAGEAITGLAAPAADQSAAPAASYAEADAASGILAYNELAAENERLRAMLDYKESNVTQELKVAQITGKEPGNWFEVFTIDLGANDGIAEGMPVVTPNGLVGKVAEVSLDSAKVITIIDARSSVSAIMERTRDTGVVKGTIGSDDLTAVLTMNYLPLDTDVIDGDVVLTSGYDEVYPKGLVVGTVTNTVDQSGGKRVTVEPGVDFRRLEEVMVLVRTEHESENSVSYEVAGTSPAYGASAQTTPSGVQQDASEAPAATPNGNGTAGNNYVIPPSGVSTEQAGGN